MTTVYDFAPSAVSPFQFGPTLDGQQYNVTVTWLLFGKRYYVNVFALDGTLVVSLPLVGSPTGISLASLAWKAGKVTATTLEPHGFKPGRPLTLTVSGATPDGFNGTVLALPTGPSTFTYPLAADPGTATIFGTESQDVDLMAGYFASRMVFREPAMQIEVSP